MNQDPPHISNNLEHHTSKHADKKTPCLVAEGKEDLYYEQDTENTREETVAD